MRFRYTQEHLDFLRPGYLEMQVPELTAAFNKKFNLNKTESQIRSALKSNNIKCGRKGNPKGTFTSFTSEQAEFIKDSYTRLSLVDLTAALNKHFSLDKTQSQVRNFTRNHKIRSGRTGAFETGRKPWNAGTKGLVKPNSGNFKKGNIAANTKPLGHERICKKDGYILIKIAEPNPYTPAKTRYKAKHVVVWESENGKAPPGMIVSFIDGNNLNCDIDNLILIPRAVGLYLNRHGYKHLPDEIKPTMMALAKLESKRFNLIKEK